MSKNWNKQFATRDNMFYELKHWIEFYAEQKKTFQEFLDMRENLFSRDNYQKLPQYAKHEIDGYWKAFMKIYVEEKYIFMYQWTDGIFYSIKELESMPDFSHFKLAKLNPDRGFFWDKDHRFS